MVPGKDFLMTSSSFKANRVAWIFVIVLGSLAGGFARERGPRVEVVCPAPPLPVRMDQRQVLAYELHVTNFDTLPLTLKRLQVFANAESEDPVSDLGEDKLAAAMIRVGSSTSAANGAKDVRIIDAGRACGRLSVDRVGLEGHASQQLATQND